MNKKTGKKVISAALASSLVLGSLAGLPLSAKGVFEHLGAGTAYAADSASTTTIKAKLVEVRKFLSADEKTAIQQARTQLLSANLDSTVELIFNKVKAKDATADTALKTQIKNFIISLATYYSPDFAEVDTIKDQYSALFYELADKSGVDRPSVSDGVTFATELEGVVSSFIKGASSNDWALYIVTNRASLKAQLKTKFDNSGTQTAKVLKAYQIGADDLVDSVLSMFTAAPKLAGATEAFVNAYSKYLKSLETTTPGNTTGGPGGGGAPSSVTGPDVKAATEALTKVTDGLAEATKGLTANKGLQEALQLVQESLREQSTIKLAAPSVTNDVAKVSIDVNAVGNAFADVKKLVEVANANLKKAFPNARALKAVAVLNIGEVKANTIEVPITLDLLKKAAANDITAIAFKVNGVSLTIDVDQLKADTTLTIVKQDKKTTVTDVTYLTSVSDAYNFTFTSGGQEVTSFAKPVEVRMPVALGGAQSNLLSFTKFDAGKLTFKGGYFNAAAKELVADNKAFSTYAVLENKVDFKDLAPVKNWAGDAIATVAAKGIVVGNGQGSFSPTGKVTRAEFATILVKAFGLENTSAKESFSDVKDGDWFQPYVAAAVEAGIVSGKSATTFDPNAPVTRAELAAMTANVLVKLEGYNAVTTPATSLKKFPDAAAVHVSLQPGVALIAEEGIVVGDAKGNFNPKANATRAEAAVIINKIIKK
jgi:hypothetical protein